MQVERLKPYRFYRREIDSCRLRSGSIPQALAEWAFCMLACIDARSGEIRDSRGIVYKVYVVTAVWDDLCLPVKEVPCVDVLVLMALQNVRWPNLRFDLCTPCGGKTFDVVHPNDEEWSAMFLGCVRRSEFDSRAEQLDCFKMPLAARTEKKKPMFTGPCAYKLWRQVKLNELK